MLASFILFIGCSGESAKKFQIIPPDQSDIDFSNTIEANDTFNVIDFYYIYNGGGVAVGDFNNDELMDVYFAGNQVSNKLYLNEGAFHFEDITKTAGVEAADIWSQGIAAIDINHDGWLDIYVCASIYGTEQERRNKLYINNGLNKEGIPTFREEAKSWGIDESGHSSNAAFFDYDLDGDLDLFVLNNFMDRKFPSKFRPSIVDGSSVNSDKLYKNMGDETFSDVSDKAGILIEGYSHGISIRDLNLDGWPDVYITNDFLPNDILYINNQDGTFTNRVSDYLKHQCFSAMGNDIADINNDGLQEIIALDMLPEINYRKKTMLLRSNPMNQINTKKFNYDLQFVRNMLHLNMGPGEEENMLFGDIGFLSQTQETDWSWSPLFADFDNDGYKDLVVANGFPGDVTDMDFAHYLNRFQNIVRSRSELFDTIPEVRIDNYMFRNNGDLTFTKMTKEWGFEAKTFSNGAAFADFDNDGDLDYITNDINGLSTLYKNNTIDKTETKANENYLRVKLNGSKMNPQGIGAKVLLYAGSKMQFHEHNIYRGFMSTVDPIIHFGLGLTDHIDSVIVFWPGTKISSTYNISSNQKIELNNSESVVNDDIELSDYLFKKDEEQIFEKIEDTQKVSYLHQEKELFEFNYQKTLPHKLSQSTPGIAVSDINQDGLEDFFIGGNAQFPGTFMIQNQNGNFNKENRIMVRDELSAKDMGILFFDVDGDDDEDLYVVSGGIEKPKQDQVYTDRLYINDGLGNFAYDNARLPDIKKSGSCVKAADIDKDGDLDLFVGTRSKPGEYPFSESSHILLNDNGFFTDASNEICPSLNTPELVTDAIWTDFDNDQWIDLIVVGEWMAIKFYKNKEGKLIDVSESALSKPSSGWWNCISGVDIDDDGDTDYIVGNLGTNSIFHGTSKYPLTIYAKDFDVNGVVDPIIVKYNRDEHFAMQPFPIYTRDDLLMQVGNLRQRVPTYRAFGKATIHDLFTSEELSESYSREASHFESSILINNGNGTFQLVPLPKKAQIAPVFGIISQDFNIDGFTDILLAGNDYSLELMTGRIDASNGLLLLGKGDGSFNTTFPHESGFMLKGDAKGMVSLFDPSGNELIVATQNKDSLVVHAHLVDNPNKIIDPKGASSAEIKLKNGKIRKHEFYYGSSYLSQSSIKLKLLDYYDKVILHQHNNDVKVIDTY